MSTTRLAEALADLAEEAPTYATADAVAATAARRRRRRAAALVAGAAVLAVSLGAAAVGGSRGAAPDRAISPLPQRWVSCAEQAPKPPPASVLDAMTRPRLPDDFMPVSVVICRGEGTRRPDGSRSIVGNEYRGTDVAALVAALRLPDITRKPGSNVACALDMYSYPWMALLDADGSWVRLAPPSSACGKPRTEVGEAIRALKLTRVDSRPYVAHEAPGPKAAGCEPSGTDWVWVEGRRSARPAPGGQPLAGATRVGLCEYHVSDGERGGVLPIGDFTRGLVLTPDRLDPIKQALSTAAPAQPCASPASRYAVLTVGGYGQVTIELDGCQRFLHRPDRGNDHLLSQGGPNLTRLLDESR